MKFRLKSPLTSAQRNALRPFRDPRWPDWFALFAPWILPAEATRRLITLPRKRLLLIHAISLLLVFPAFMMLTAVRRQFHGEAWSRLIPNFFNDFIDGIGNAVGDPVGTLTQLGITLALVEGGSLIIALLATPVGARNETLANSFAHAFRRVWLHAGLLPLSVLMVGFADLASEEAATTWETSISPQMHRVRPLCEYLNPDVNYTGPSKAAFNARRERHSDEFNAFDAWIPRPWYVTYRAETKAFSITLVCMALLWSVWRGIQAPRPLIPEVQPRRCRRCGYVLIGMADDGQCPECAFPVAQSVADDVDLGSPWNRCYPTNAIPAYFVTLLQFILRPRHHAQRLRAFEHPNDAPRFLLITSILTAIAFGLIVGWKGHLQGQGLTIGLSLASLGIGLIPLLFASGSALWVAWRFHLKDDRNMLKGIHNVSAYTSGYLLLIVLVLAWILRHLEWVERGVNNLATQLSWSSGYVFTLGSVIVGLLLFCAYTAIVRHAAQGIRYAFR